LTISALRGTRSQLESMVGLSSKSGASSSTGPLNLSNSQSEEKAPAQPQQQQMVQLEVQALPQKTPAKDPQALGDKSTTHHDDSGTPTPIAHSTPGPNGAAPVKTQAVQQMEVSFLQIIAWQLDNSQPFQDDEEEGEINDLTTFLENVARQMNTGLQDQCADPELLMKYEEMEREQLKKEKKLSESTESSLSISTSSPSPFRALEDAAGPPRPQEGHPPTPALEEAAAPERRDPATSCAPRRL